jgi:histidinol-phosphatase (PHP family)
MAGAPPPPDRHVHTEWSWDATHGDMRATCARALELGLPGVAFTEHADFTTWVRSHGRGDLDITGYWSAIEACRAAHPALRIESGIELGEPHLFPEQAAAVLAHRPPDRVLGSLHSLDRAGQLVDMSAPGMLAPDIAAGQLRRYLGATLELVQSAIPFTILTHLDYPKRYWPHGQVRFDETDYQEEYRAVLTALARSGRVLEVNSSRAMGPPRGPCPGLLPLRWWHEAGGAAVSFGSDAHRPEHLAAGLREAAELAEAAGYRPTDDPLDLWVRA